MKIKRKLALKIHAITMVIALMPCLSWAEDGNVGPYKLLNFGITERVTTQSTFSGVNYSTLVSWNPHYNFSSSLHLEGQVGFTAMTSNLGTFFVSRAQVGASYHGLFDQHFVPEVLVGMEDWAISAGGVYFATSVNLHYRLLIKDMGILNALDSVHLGYQWIPGAPSSAQQYTLGIRIALWPEFPVESTPKEESKVVQAPVATPVAESIAVPTKKTIEQLTGKLENILFVKGKTKIDAVSFSTLDKVVETLKAQPDLRIRVEGHTDNMGSKVSNQKLSEGRAKSVREYLANHGIDKGRLESAGFGSDQPIKDNNTDEGRAANRRVEFIIIEKN